MWMSSQAAMHKQATVFAVQLLGSSDARRLILFFSVFGRVASVLHAASSIER